MREIEFRGKCIDTNEWWAYGVPVKTQLNCCDNGVELVEEAIDFEHDSGFPRFAYSVNVVDENTIGQYTGLKDKNGQKIFEGDIVEFDFYDIGKQRAFVYWNEKYGAFLLKVISSNFGYTTISEGKVIGNIWDNGDLINEN